MSLTGKSLVAGQWLAQEDASSFQAYCPIDDSDMPQPYFNATAEELNAAVAEAENAFYQFAETSKEQRAEFLETIAEQILALGDELLETTNKETALPLVRLTGERGRTMNQLKLFAQYLRNDSDMSIDEAADPNREPLPKPATKLDYLPVGPVAVFGASNFPYAFSVAGGDTAAALAAGCPVVVKGHPAHPGTSELVSRAIAKAVELCNLPAGVFSMLQTSEPELSHELVRHPSIKAVGFTGSYGVASALQSSIDKRQERIPLYGELGSVNPQVVLPKKSQFEAQPLAETMVQSLVMGLGQFCTNPGLWLVPEEATEFVQFSAEALSKQAAGPLLTRGIKASYDKAIAELSQVTGVESLAVGQTGEAHHASPRLFKTDATTFLANEALQEEIFGPSALIVTYQDQEQLAAIVDSLGGQLTASVLASDDELENYTNLLNKLKFKVGRLIMNQMPTGVEVCYSMNHGGPYPATTDVRSTSVGTEAMKRFLRPICYQK